MNVELRLKIAQYLTAGYGSVLTALREDGVLTDDDTDPARAAEDEKEAAAFLREATTALMFVADQDEKRLAKDRTEGDYREAVEKLVDGVVEDIKACKHPDEWSAKVAIRAAVDRNEYVTDADLHRAVLDFGTHPSAYHYAHPCRSPLSRLPWQDMVGWCMWADAKEELERRAEFAALR